MEPKVLKIIKTTYGVSKIPVIQLNYGDGGEIPTFEVKKDTVDVELMRRISQAVNKGYTIQMEEGLHL